MSEHDSRRQFAACIPHRHPVPVENWMACPGTPDLSYRSGWIEFKHLGKWPARADTVVTVDSNAQKLKRQVAWLNARWDAGEACWLVLSVGKGTKKEWLVFSAPRARALNTLSRRRMYVEAYWAGSSNDLAAEIDGVLDSTVAEADAKEERT